MEKCFYRSFLIHREDHELLDLEIILSHCLRKEIFSQHRIRHQDLTEYIFRLQSRHHQLVGIRRHLVFESYLIDIFNLLNMVHLTIQGCGIDIFKVTSSHRSSI